jgi:uncharacterized protein with NAD-binding domain and iron-sulfur cluster
MAQKNAAVIGGGLGGLIAALRLLQNGHRVTLYERSDQLGGRAGMMRFAGIDVVTGAGILRFHKDKRLLALLNEFQIDHSVFPPSPKAEPDFQIIKLYEILLNATPKQQESFEAFAKRTLGRVNYEYFIHHMGYTDMEKASARETLSYYGLDDNIFPYTIVKFSWKDLVKKLVERIRKLGATILMNRSIDKRIVVREHSILVDGKSYDHVVVATTISSLQKLLPKSILEYYKDIRAQPFLRTYAQFSKDTRGLVAERMAGNYRTVGHPLQKILTMDESRGVYMIAYADNNAAVSHSRHLENISYWENLVEKALSLPPGSLKILKVKSCFWKEGTHYRIGTEKRYPIQTIVCPMKNVSVVGEAVTNHHGWTEGLLETIDTFVHCNGMR